jgi:hypothetical protein
MYANLNAEGLPSQNEGGPFVIRRVFGNHPSVV